MGEHDANEMEYPVGCGGKRTKAGLTVKNIAAIGITNQRETTVVWDRASGQPL